MNARRRARGGLRQWLGSVFQGRAPGSPDTNIFFIDLSGWDGVSYATPHAVTANTDPWAPDHPQISGDVVVFHDSDGNTTTIYYWDSSTWDGMSPIVPLPVPISDPSPSQPAIAGSHVLFVAQPSAGPSEIFYWDATGWDGVSAVATTQLTSTGSLLDESGTRLHGDRAVWFVFGFGPLDQEVYFWDLGAWDGSPTPTILPFTANTVDDAYPDVADDLVVWQQHDENDLEIMVWDGTTTVALTDNDVHDGAPRVWGNAVVWNQWDGTTSAIYYASTDPIIVPAEIPALGPAGLTALALLLALAARRRAYMLV